MVTERCANCQVGQGRDCICSEPADASRIWVTVLCALGGWIIGALVLVAWGHLWTP